jgi:hypothetical protein
MFPFKVNLFILLPTMVVLGIDSLISDAYRNEDSVLNFRIHNG